MAHSIPRTLPRQSTRSSRSRSGYPDPILAVARIVYGCVWHNGDDGFEERGLEDAGGGGRGLVECG
jgi:hypothetical protein